MTPKQLDEIEKRWGGYLEKNEVERRFLFDQWWDKRDFWDMTKALREAWEERDKYKAALQKVRSLAGAMSKWPDVIDMKACEAKINNLADEALKGGEG